MCAGVIICHIGCYCKVICKMAEITFWIIPCSSGAEFVYGSKSSAASGGCYDGGWTDFPRCIAII